MVVGNIQYLFVMGGRAREFVEYSESKAIGGIIGPRVQDPENPNLLFSTHREASILKNDVWRSVDGSNWQLVTPGCRAPQVELVPQKKSSFILNGKVVHNTTYGLAKFACKTDQDCYGEEKCDLRYKTCVCGMWSPREQFGAVVYKGWMYVAGGYTSVSYSQKSFCGNYACGETDPSDYRNYMNVYNPFICTYHRKSNLTVVLNTYIRIFGDGMERKMAGNGLSYF
jgi:hypothetical protein